MNSFRISLIDPQTSRQGSLTFFFPYRVNFYLHRFRKFNGTEVIELVFDGDRILTIEMLNNIYQDISTEGLSVIGRADAFLAGHKQLFIFPKGDEDHNKYYPQHAPEVRIETFDEARNTLIFHSMCPSGSATTHEYVFPTDTRFAVERTYTDSGHTTKYVFEAGTYVEIGLDGATINLTTENLSESVEIDTTELHRVRLSVSQ